jgi:hypothetical protein
VNSRLRTYRSFCHSDAYDRSDTAPIRADGPRHMAGPPDLERTREFGEAATRLAASNPVAISLWLWCDRGASYATPIWLSACG